MLKLESLNRHEMSAAAVALASAAAAASAALGEY